MFVIRNKWIFIAIAGILGLLALGVILVKGINMGIEFTGGSIVEVSYTELPTLDQVNTAIADFDDHAVVQPFGDHGYVIRTQELTESDREILLQSLEINGQSPQLERFNTVGPTIGKELRAKALWAMILVLLAIVFFIAFAFRQVSEPVSSWKYGIIAIITLAFDVIIPLGIFVLLGKEATTLLVVGLLSILGLSVNDTIVIFDRIRENLKDNLENKGKEKFDVLIGKAIKQTMARSINTSLTLVLVLVALVVFGPTATQDLALVLLLGTFFGAYSSIFLASPLLIVWNKNKENL
jgi:preprotein translocase subunit SecF